MDSYDVAWLNSVYQETLLPGSPWHKIAEPICSALAQEVKQLEPNSVLQLAVLGNLGSPFINKYMADDVIRLSKIATSKKDMEANSKAQTWLKEKMDKIIRDQGLEKASTDNHTNVSPSMLEYNHFVHQVVCRGIDEQLAMAEQKLDSKSFVENSTLSGIQSETLGQAVSSILIKHPTQIHKITHRLYGRQLPNSLRKLVWKLKIYQPKEKDLQSYVGQLKKEFDASIVWGMKDSGVNDTMSSTIYGVIKHGVGEIYNKVPCIDNHKMRQECYKVAKDALNILYVHGRSYEPHHALMLLPFIWTYYIGNTVPSQEFTRTDLSHMLLYFLRNCFPTRLQVFSYADGVIDKLKANDPILYEHLVHVMQKNVASESREFLVNFLHKEKEQAAELTGLQGKPTGAQALLSHPVIFMRQWIGEGFVGVLSHPSILLVWDQCFLTDWQPSIIENVCLVLLEFLRGKLLLAMDYDSVKNILFNHVYSLLTYEIQQGLAYLNNGGSILDVTSVQTVSTASSIGDSIQDHSHGVHTSSHSSEEEQLGDLWIENTLKNTVKSCGEADSFHIYVDEVRFIPDNATVIKVTGRILNHLWKKPSSLDLSDVEAYSLLDSPARCPIFHYRYTIHPKESILHDCVLLLRVYTLDVYTGELVVIGNAALELYKELEPEKFCLAIGGHQLRIKHELPSSVSTLSQELFYQLKNIPAASVLIRILPHEEIFVDAPGYSSGFYDSLNCIPDETEITICKHFKMLQPYPPTVIEAIRDIREEELNVEDEEVTDQEMEQWYHQRMSKLQLERKPAKSLNLTRLVQYNQSQGVFVQVDQAFGLPVPIFVNALVFMSLGPDARINGKCSDEDKSSLFDERDFNSFLKSPKWIDKPKLFHTPLDRCSSLIIQLYGLDATYVPTVEGQTTGSVTAKKGKVMSLIPQGWTVLKLFDKKYVNSGVHNLPLFEGKPSSIFMEFLSSQPGDIGLNEAVRQDIHQLQGSSCITVRIWDGHFIQFDYLPQPTNQDFLKLGNETKIKKTMQATSGKKYSDIILQYLNKQQRKLGTDGLPYTKEKQNYEEAMNSAFNDLMDNVLLEIGLGPTN